jgi:hypothetical protein
MTYGGRVKTKLAQWRGAWLERRTERHTESQWMSHHRTMVVGLSLLLACFSLAFGIVATAIGATFMH